VAVIDLTPQVLDITALGGDTVSFEVRFPPGYVAGRTWTAQVRAKPEDTSVDATWIVALGATADDPIHLTLTAATTRSLVTSAALARQTSSVVRRSSAQPTAPFAAGEPLATYKGVWDCQLAPAGGGDPTTTVITGSVTIKLDVTRAP
jgi:hypothetical protein